MECTRVRWDIRKLLKGHKACMLWFTGLNGLGKSTLAGLEENKIYERASAPISCVTTMSERA